MKPATEPDPAAVVRLFQERAPLAYRYADLLTHEGVQRGLLGPREAPRVWPRHLLNCAVISSAIPPHARLCDLGSGAGLPGIVLAIARPDLTVTLVEPMLRRVTFLEEVIADLSLQHVEVRRSRAEELVGRVAFDVVTARAVASLEVLVRWGLPLVAPGGELVAMKGESADAELSAAAAAISRYGGAQARIEVLGDGMVTPLATVVRIRSTRTHPQQKGSR